MRNELLEKLLDAMNRQNLVMLIVSGKGVQLSDWRLIVDIRDTSANGNVIVFEGNMELYLDFDELDVEYNDIDDEYVLLTKGNHAEVRIQFVM